MYRSLAHRSRASIAGSKYRTGETTFLIASIRAGTSSVEPRIHPRINLPWNGTRTREPTPASSSGGNRYVNGRSRLRIGRSIQTATGPAGTLSDGATEVLDAVGRLPGELFATEMTVCRGLAIDGTGELQITDDGRRSEVE